MTAAIKGDISSTNNVIRRTVYLRKDLDDWLKQRRIERAGKESARLLSYQVNTCLDSCKHHINTDCKEPLHPDI